MQITFQVKSLYMKSGGVLGKILIGSYPDTFADVLSEYKVYDRMKSKTYAWGIVSEIVNTQNGYLILEEFLKNDKRKNKENSIAYMRAFRESIINGNASIFTELNKYIKYSKETIIRILEEDMDLYIDSSKGWEKGDYWPYVSLLYKIDVPSNLERFKGLIKHNLPFTLFKDIYRVGVVYCIWDTSDDKWFRRKYGDQFTDLAKETSTLHSC